MIAAIIAGSGFAYGLLAVLTARYCAGGAYRSYEPLPNRDNLFQTPEGWAVWCFTWALVFAPVIWAFWLIAGTIWLFVCGAEHLIPEITRARREERRKREREAAEVVAADIQHLEKEILDDDGTAE